MRKKPFNLLILVFGIAILMAIIFIIIGQKNKDSLPVYKGGEALSEETPTEKELEIPVSTYLDDSNMFSVAVPDGWERVDHGNRMEFVHAPSKTSISIELTDYDPLINNRDSASVSTRIVQEGYSFVSFAQTSNASSETIYKKNDTVDYILEELWCRNGIVRLLFTLNDENYSKMLPYLNKILQSFQWGKSADVIPEGYYLQYIEYGDFEFAIPGGWNFSVQDGVGYLINADNSAEMTLRVVEYTGTLTDITTYRFTEILKPGRENGFMIKNSSASVNQASADISYLNQNGINMVNSTYLFANGHYLYEMQYDYVSNSIDSSLPSTSASLFREFLTKKIAEHPELYTEPETEEPTSEVEELTSEVEESTTEEITTEQASTEQTTSSEGYSWHKSDKGWWYGDSSWFAKNIEITIEGKSYKFDENGYLID